MKNVQIIHWINLTIITCAVVLLLILPVGRLRAKIEINYSEGVNVYNCLGAISGKYLYNPEYEWTPVNYRPFSYYIVGGAGILLGDPLLAGRLILIVSLFVVCFFVAYVVRKLGAQLMTHCLQASCV